MKVDTYWHVKVNWNINDFAPPLAVNQLSVSQATCIHILHLQTRSDDYRATFFDWF